MRSTPPRGHSPGMTTTPTVTPSGTGWRLARATAPLAARFAGHRMVPLWALVQHTGRRSGRALEVPVAVTATPRGLLVNLPYGPGTNWVRNVLAAGGCTVVWRGRELPCDRPELLGPAQARPHFSALTWWVARTLFTGESFLLLHPR
jgi:hypothetical protein